MNLNDIVVTCIRKLMQSKKLTQNDLSKVLKIPQSGISDRLSGKTLFTLGDLEKLQSLGWRVDIKISAKSEVA